MGKQYGLDFIITFVLKHTSIPLSEIYELTPRQLNEISSNIFEIIKLENGEGGNIGELKTTGNNSNGETMNSVINKEEIINAAKQKILADAIKKAKEQGKTLSTKDLYKLFKGF